MARVIARVELHGASGADYTMLHAAMAREGFARSVRASDGVYYHLPTGEYVHDNVTGVTVAKDKAVRAAQTTGRSSSIFVGGWDGSWAGTGLTRAS